MSRITWNALGTRFFETGIDRGVLYVPGQPGVSWTGLTSVTEKPNGGDVESFYIDGVKYLSFASSEEFAATLTAFTYPPEFGVCDGTARVHSGLFVTQQRRKPFSFCYRSRLGNDVSAADYGYKLHLVYNCLASPSSKTYKTMNNSGEPTDFSWDLTTTPPVMAGFKRTAHLEVDSRYTAPVVMAAIEDILYGTDDLIPRIPTLAELVAIYDANSIFIVTDNEDGSFTVDGPDSMITMIDADHWEITSDSAIFFDDHSYSLTSA